MSHLTFSVIIPAYNGSGFIDKAIDSVLAQSYPNFEIIVVDDVSSDNTGEIVQAYADPRVRYIKHTVNLGADMARKTALDASTGDLIAFLDQDDYFHSDKLAVHVQHYIESPETGLTYNARYDFDGESGHIREIWRPPDVITLADLCMGFPFAPSDTVLRREWALREEIWDQSTVLVGEEVIVNGTEIIFCGRLFLAGCLFASVPGTLNYRRYHPARNFSDLDIRCRAELLCQEAIFNDERCPEDVRKQSHLAYMNTNLIWAFYAYAQNEIGLGKQFAAEAVRLNPGLLDSDPCALTEAMLFNSCNDSRPHAELLNRIFDNLPEECEGIAIQKEPAIAQGYLIEGTRAMQWGRHEEGHALLSEAVNLQAELSEEFLQKAVHQFLQMESEQGVKATRSIIENLTPFFKQLGGKEKARYFKSCYDINQAYHHFLSGNYANVPGDVIRATFNDYRKLKDRGVLSIFLRSISRMHLKNASVAS